MINTGVDGLQDDFGDDPTELACALLDADVLEFENGVAIEFDDKLIDEMGAELTELEETIADEPTEKTFDNDKSGQFSA